MQTVACLKNFGIPLYEFLSISADDRNLYKSIKSDLDKGIKDHGLAR